MRTLIDTYWWFDGPPSGRAVVRSLVDAWQREFPADDLVLTRPPGAADIAGQQTVSLPYDSHLRTNATAFDWCSAHGPFDAALFQNFTPVRSPAGTSVGVFIHDVIFRRQPHWFTHRERIYLAPIVPLASRADVVFTSSKNEAGHLRHERWLRYTKTPVRAVGLALPRHFAESSATNGPSALYDELPRSYLLAVGRLNKRKNLPWLIRSLVSTGAVSAECPLVIVGGLDGRNPGFDDVSAAIDERVVVFMGHVTDEELAELYRRAEIVIFPSLDEGFGLPLLEASAFGVPVLCSDIPVFREVMADEATFFDPTSTSSLLEALRSCRSRSGSSKRARHEMYDWGATVQKLREDLRLALHRQ